MKVIILAAGSGNRLKPHTNTLPKSLLPFMKDGHERETLLTYILTELPTYIDEVFIVVKYLEHTIRDFVDTHKEYIKNLNPNIKNITCLTQTGEKGTMGALLTVKDIIDKSERFLVINGDDLHAKKELEAFNNHQRAFGVQKKIMLGYKSVSVQDNGIVSGLTNQTEEEKSNGCLIATGAYLLDGNFFDFDPIVISDGEIGLPHTLMANVNTYPSYVVEEKSWISINTVEDLEGLWYSTKICQINLR